MSPQPHLTSYLSPLTRLSQRTAPVTPLKVVAIALTVACVVLALVGQKLASRPLVSAGIATLGVAGLVAAADGWILRRQSVVESTSRYTTYHGRAARFASVWLAMVGVALLVAAWAWLTNSVEGTLEFLARRPGVVLLAVGVAYASNGMAEVLGPRQNESPDSPSEATWLSRLGGRAAVVFGLVLCAIGALEIVLPSAFDAMVRGVWGLIKGALIGG